MENETKIIGTAALILLIGTFTYIGLPETTANYQEPNYYCLNASIKMYCNSLSAYYGLPDGKCVNADYGNKLCRSGWKEIPIAIESKLSEGRKTRCYPDESKTDFVQCDEGWK